MAFLLWDRDYRSERVEPVRALGAVEVGVEWMAWGKVYESSLTVQFAIRSVSYLFCCADVF
jgi:hypothetical protein